MTLKIGLKGIVAFAFLIAVSLAFDVFCVWHLSNMSSEAQDLNSSDRMPCWCLLYVM